VNDDFLRDELQQARDAHTPDRTAMLNRIAANRAADGVADRAADGVADRAADGVTDRAADGTTDRAADRVADRAGDTDRAAGRATSRAVDGVAGRAGDRATADRPRGRAVRLVGSAVAVATVLGLGGVAKWALADNADPTPAAPAAAGASASPSPTVVATAPGSLPVTSRPRSEAPVSTTTAPSPTGPTGATGATGQVEPTPAGSPVRGHPGDTQVEKGSLWSDGSITAAGRSTVTLKPGADLTELDLTIRVTMTPGLTSAGFDAPDRVTASVSRDGAALLYRFVLKPGATMTAGEYSLTAKYTAASRDAGDDTYEAYATSVEHKRIHVYGNFAATD
jgi:hypothetical protein